MPGSEEASSSNKCTEDKNYKECSSKNFPLNCKIPSLLVKTLEELIDCADDMEEALSSITVQNMKENANENNVDDVNHIFLIPQLRNTHDNIRKYTDFTMIGRRVLGIIKFQ